MRRRLFTILSTLVLLLFVAMIVLWVRSYLVTDAFMWHVFEDDAESTKWVQSNVMIGWGGVGFQRIVQAGPKATWREQIGDALRQHAEPFHQRTSPAHYPNSNFAANTATEEKGRAGFKWGYYEYQAPGYWGWLYQITIPFWALLLLALPPVAVPAWWHVKRRRAEQRGLCPSCGYDLRATPDQCPECGRVPASPSPSASG